MEHCLTCSDGITSLNVAFHTEIETWVSPFVHPGRWPLPTADLVKELAQQNILCSPLLGEFLFFCFGVLPQPCNLLPVLCFDPLRRGLPLLPECHPPSYPSSLKPFLIPAAARASSASMTLPSCAASMLDALHLILNGPPLNWSFCAQRSAEHLSVRVHRLLLGRLATRALTDCEGVLWEPASFDSHGGRNSVAMGSGRTRRYWTSFSAKLSRTPSYLPRTSIRCSLFPPSAASP